MNDSRRWDVSLLIAAEYVIIGAGFAGAATAYHLSRRGASDILLLEQETIPGFHSSGRNAAMIRQCVPDPDLLALTRDGSRFLRNLPADWPEPVQFKQNGSLLLGSGDGWVKLQRDAELGRSLGVEMELWTPEQAKRRVPALKEAEFDGAAWCGSDGVLDIHALLSGYLKAASAKGTRIRYGGAAQSIDSGADGLTVVVNPSTQAPALAGGSRSGFRPTGILEGAAGLPVGLHGETIRAKVVVNASGAWANAVAKMAGAAELPLRPCRRHLFVSPPLAWVDKSWPFVWDVTHDIYFRPEGEGLLLCACDQTELPPGDPPVDAAVKELLAEKIERHMPALAGVSISRGWAGLRTLSSDGRFVIGWDAKVNGFFWVAGLGGHGVTASSAVGALAADLLLAGSGKKSEAFSPERFAD